jgi:hypothetical protein
MSGVVCFVWRIAMNKSANVTGCHRGFAVGKIEHPISARIFTERPDYAFFARVGKGRLNPQNRLASLCLFSYLRIRGFLAPSLVVLPTHMMGNNPLAAPVKFA